MGDADAEPPKSEYADKDGQFRRPDSAFRDWISRDPESKFPAEKGRYVLYANYGCPWAHRAILVRALKDLEDIIQLVLTDFDLSENGWLFTGRNGSADRDPLYGFAGLKQLYLKADPEYVGRYTVPTLWDKKTETIVNNESSEIIRMFYSEFDTLLDPLHRESNKSNGTAGLYPEHLRVSIDEMNEWVYNTINNGVYKCGFATTQSAYESALYPLFNSLDRVESHLSNASSCLGGPFLFGQHLTEADVRLYTTIARFDAAYHTIFMCNLKSIRHDYPRIYRWLRRLYWNISDVPNGKVFKDSTHFDVYRFGYMRARTKQHQIPFFVVPKGPLTDIDAWTEDDDDIDRGRRIAYEHANGGEVPQLKALEISEGKTRGFNGMRTPRANNGAANEDNAPGPGKLVRRTTYETENQKWYKAAKKAEKKSGAPNVHLAL